VYLLGLARTHHITPEVLHDSLLGLRHRGKVQCGALEIEIRALGEQSSTYMFSLNGKPFAQANLQDDSVRKLKRVPEEYSSRRLVVSDSD
jgi:hypothetical protein